MANLISVSVAGVAVIAGVAGAGWALKPTVVGFHTVTTHVKGFSLQGDDSDGKTVRLSCPAGETAVSGSYAGETYYRTETGIRDVLPGGVRTLQSYPETKNTWRFVLEGDQSGVEGPQTRATFYVVCARSGKRFG